MRDLSDLLEKLSTENGKQIIVGDFNIHWEDKKNTESVRFRQLVESFGFIQHVVGATHNSGSTLDLVLSRKSDDLVHD